MKMKLLIFSMVGAGVYFLLLSRDSEAMKEIKRLQELEDYLDEDVEFEDDISPNGGL